MFVVSTTGDGDPPDTVLKFWRRIRKKTLESTYLKGLRYALLGTYIVHHSEQDANKCRPENAVLHDVEGTVTYRDAGSGTDILA